MTEQMKREEEPIKESAVNFYLTKIAKLLGSSVAGDLLAALVTSDLPVVLAAAAVAALASYFADRLDKRPEVTVDRPPQKSNLPDQKG